MEKTEKKYTVPLTDAQLQIEVGMIFYDHGKKMRLTRIGTSYIDDSGRWAFDTWAEPYQEAV